MAGKKKNRRRQRTAGLVVLLLVLFAVWYGSDEPDPGTDSTGTAPDSEEDAEGSGNRIPVTLVRTIDGDTIKIRYEGKEQNVRYLLIDTPETNHPRLGKQPFGEQAKERNRELLARGDVSIEFDIGNRTDKYDRLLAYVYVDGESVQEKLLEEGLARVGYVYPPSTRYLDRFEAAERKAKERGIGIWSIEDYATDRGFDPSKVGESDKESGNIKQNEQGGESYANCTELRKRYPDGVKKGHPAYTSRMDGDRDGTACESA